MAGKNVLQNIDSTGTQFRPEYDERDLGECAHCVEREAPWASESASVGAPCIVSVLVFSGFIPGWWSVLMMHIVCSCFIQVRCTISAPRLRLGFLPNQGDVGMSRRSSPLRLFFAFLSLSWWMCVVWLGWWDLIWCARWHALMLWGSALITRFDLLATIGD